MSVRWKPGDVAVASVRGEGEVRIMRTGDSRELFVYARPGRGMDSIDWASIDADQIHDARRLVVLDLNEQSTRRVIEVLACAGLNQIANMIAEQTKPPRPDEPQGLGAVVEDAGEHLWIRHGSGPAAWMLAGASPSNRDTYPYADIDVVRVLSEGVRP